MVTQRARKDEDKAERRRSILDTAEQLLTSHGYHQITMAEVARRAGLAKGTLYLYFKSKEEMFLAKLQMELQQWFAGVDQLVSAGPVTPRQFAEAIATSLEAQPRLLELMALLHNVLEHNIEVDVARNFKRGLLMHMQHAAIGVESALPDLPPGSGTLLLMRLYAMVVGMRQMADPAPAVAEVLVEADLAPLRVDFAPDFAAAMVDLIRGMTTPHTPADAQ